MIFKPVRIRDVRQSAKSLEGDLPATESLFETSSRSSRIRLSADSADHHGRSLVEISHVTPKGFVEVGSRDWIDRRNRADPSKISIWLDQRSIGQGFSSPVRLGERMADLDWKGLTPTLNNRFEKIPEIA